MKFKELDIMTDEQAETVAQELLTAHETAQTISRPNPHYRELQTPGTCGEVLVRPGICPSRDVKV